MTAKSPLNKVKKELTKLSAEYSETRKSRMFKELLPFIDKLRKIGFSHAAIIERINDNGLQISGSTYQTYLRRNRLQALPKKKAL